jgi:hypothetical protein
VLLAGRFAVARSALLARPEGPVNGLDLSRGAPVVLELLSAAAGEGLAAGSDGRHVRRHRGGWVLASDPPPVAPADPLPVAARSRPERVRLEGLRRELASRRVRITAVAAAGAACVLVALGLLGGVRTGGTGTARAASPPVLREVAPAARPVLAPPRTAVRTHVVPAARPVTRGGVARLLVAAPPVRPRRTVPAARAAAPVRHARTATRSRAPVRSTGWVAGLFVGQ